MYFTKNCRLPKNIIRRVAHKPSKPKALSSVWGDSILTLLYDKYNYNRKRAYFFMLEYIYIYLLLRYEEKSVIKNIDHEKYWMSRICSFLMTENHCCFVVLWHSVLISIDVEVLGASTDQEREKESRQPSQISLWLIRSPMSAGRMNICPVNVRASVGRH